MYACPVMHAVPTDPCVVNPALGHGRGGCRTAALGPGRRRWV